MQIRTIAIASLRSDPVNARKHGAKNLQAIKASLTRFGQQKPIVIDSQNIVRAGNGTLAAAKELGWTEIQCVVSDLPDRELTAFAVADNRTAELAEWDQEILSLMASAGELTNVGFDDAELNRILEDLSSNDSFGMAGAIEERFEVVVECRDEAEQKDVLENLTTQGLKCRLFTL